MSDSPSLFPPPLNPHDPGRGPMIMGIVWSLTIVSIALIGSRFYVRAVMLRALGTDDWLMLVAGIFQIVSSACLTRAYVWGLGMHDADMYYIPQIVNVYKWGWISSVPGTIGTIIARISIAVLLVRLFGNKTWLKWFLIIFSVIQSILSIMFLVIVFCSVSPVEALWNQLIPARRWDPRVQLYAAIVAQSLLSFSDLTYVLFPVTVIWKLHMPVRQKIGLAILMAMSLVTMAASILKAVLSNIIPNITGDSNEPPPDAQYISSLSIFTGNVEQCLVIIMGCIAPLAPMVKLRFLHSIYTKLSGLVERLSSSRTRGKGSDYVPGAHSVYHNLDLMDSNQLGKLHINQNDEGQTLKPLSTFEVTALKAHEKHSSNHIRRTDQFHVSYDKKRSAA
ncbi:hypothetical protein M434DRAFT_79747 [Hypoxylon sp. CO27-5]|nr:hypothetical protein M434DRAFT_79747 [Hypoxylon sp. CO27-5]